MTALIAIRVLGPLALLLSPLALQAAPGNKPMRVYSARMETVSYTHLTLPTTPYV